MIINPILPVWFMLLMLSLFWVCLSTERKKLIRQLCILVLIFIINLRIMVPSNTTDMISTDLDVLFVIDTTVSMAAEDYKGQKTRMSAIKADCKYIVEELEGAKFSIMTFDDTSKVLVPYTTDKNIIFETIDILQPSNYVFARGTSLNEPINNMLAQFQSSSKTSGRARVVFFMSDGEITNNDTLDVAGYESLNSYISDGAVLGYGTTTGGYMYVPIDSKGNYSYVEDKTSYPYTKAVSKIDENNLRSVAESLKVDYINMSDQSNIDDKLEEIKDGVTYKFNSIDKESYQDTYFIFVIPLLGLLIYEFINFRKRV